MSIIRNSNQWPSETNPESSRLGGCFILVDFDLYVMGRILKHPLLIILLRSDPRNRFILSIVIIQH